MPCIALPPETLEGKSRGRAFRIRAGLETFEGARKSSDPWQRMLDGARDVLATRYRRRILHRGQRNKAAVVRAPEILQQPPE